MKKFYLRSRPPATISYYALCLLFFGGWSIFYAPEALGQSIWQKIFETPRSLSRNANKDYADKNFQGAEYKYRLSLEKDKNFTESVFNLGNALYRQQKYEEAIERFRTIAEDAKSPSRLRAESYYNLGNALLQSDKFAESVDAYKNALRLNPRDNEARNNLALVQRYLKQFPPPTPPQNNESNEQSQENQSSSGKALYNDAQLSKSDIMRILEALMNEEKVVHRRLMKRKSSGSLIDKDW
jgi:tetratricopeptide (TPR) repeat protein